MTNTMSCVSFQLTPWMTLNCYEVTFFGISRVFAILEGNDG